MNKSKRMLTTPVYFNIKTKCDSCQQKKWCLRIPFTLTFFCRKCYDSGMGILANTSGEMIMRDYCYDLPRTVICYVCDKVFHLKERQLHFHCGTMVAVLEKVNG